MLAPPLSAEPLEVSVVFPEDASEPEAADRPVAAQPVTARLTAHPVTGSFDGEEPESVAVELTVPGTARLDFPARTVWALDVEASGYFAPEAFAAAGEVERVVVRLWPTARLVGGIEVEPGEEAPGELALRFSPAGGETPEELAGALTCPVAEGRFRCELPAGRFDLRFRAGGFVSHYLWATAVAAGEEHEIGPLRLRRGASVVGRVETADGTPLDSSCRASLEPRFTPRQLPDGEAASERFALEVEVPPRGFLHLEGVAPGSYALTVEQKGFAPSRVEPITVLQNTETEAPETIVLRRPLDLDLYIEPPLDLLGEPWRVEILPPSLLAAALAKGRSDAAGHFREPALPAGDYAVAVIDSQGSRMALEEITLEPGKTVFPVELPIVEVEGLLTLGEEPLPEAFVTFREKGKMIAVEFETGEEGDFGGFLPRAGTWYVDVEADEPPIYRRLRGVEVEPKPGSTVARVEIELPDTVFAGRTIDAAGEIVRFATVLISPYSNREPISHATSDQEGEFAFHGFAPGTFRVEARATTSGRNLASHGLDVVMDEDEARRDVELVLRPLAELRGVLTSSTGPVLGARVHVRVVDRPVHGLILPTARSDVRGEFSVRLSELPAQVEVTVMAPGYALRRLRASALPDQSLTVPVDSAAGSVRLELGESPPLTYADTPNVTVVHEGFRYHLNELLSWAVMNGEVRQSGFAKKIPMMPPGVYELCLPKTKEAAEPPRCSTGFLAPGGELVLELPDGP